MADFITGTGQSQCDGAQVFPSTTVCTQPSPGAYAYRLVANPAANTAITIQNESVTNTTAQVYPSNPNTITGGNQTTGAQAILPQAKHTFTFTAGSPSSWIVT